MNARGQVRVTVRAAAAAAGTVRIVDAKGRALTATVAVRLRRAGTTTVVLPLTRTARRAVRGATVRGRATLALRTPQGATSTASVPVKVRGR